MTNPNSCYYKNGEVHCTVAKKQEIDADIGGAPANGWEQQGCFCIDNDCTIAKCDGSECGSFAVFVKTSTGEVIIIPGGGFC